MVERAQPPPGCLPPPQQRPESRFRRADAPRYLHRILRAVLSLFFFFFFERAWGSAFKHLKSIKEVEIEFETSDDKKDELLAILKWARTWKFPLDGGMLLSAEGTDVTVMSWQTPLCYWSDICPYCRGCWSCGYVWRSKLRNEKC